MSLRDIEIEIAGLGPRALFPDGIPERLRAYQKKCHPDLFPPEDRDKASELLVKITAMAEEAAKPLVVVKGTKWDYHLGDLIAIGDIADVYRATNLQGGDYIVKISRVPEGYAIMLREQELLKAVIETAQVLKVDSYERYTPIPVENFTIKDGFKKHVAVSVYDKHLLTFSDICLRYTVRHGTSLPGEHVAWMLRRALEYLGFLHSCGYVHGAITPEHLMFTPDRHGMNLVGFGQNVKFGNTVDLIVPKYSHYYAPEILAKKKLHDGTADVYMLGKVLNEAVKASPDPNDRKLSKFLEGMSTETPGSRSHAWRLHDEFTSWCLRVYGPPAFHVLEL